MSKKKQLLAEIDRIIDKVKAYNGPKYVCVVAMGGRFSYEIRHMVKRHIGGEYTMEDFLFSKGIPTNQAKHYRILMLENMKKMVEKELK